MASAVECKNDMATCSPIDTGLTHGCSANVPKNGAEARRLRREAKAVAVIKTIGAKPPTVADFIPYLPPRPDPTYTFWKLPNDTMPNSIVYFMYSAGRIKIGFSGGLRGRHQQLRTTGAFPPVVLLIIKGTERTEKEYHARFPDDRLHGEWFTLSKRLRTFLMSRLCDVGRASLERAEAEFRDYCGSFLDAYRPAPAKRKPREICQHGKPLHQRCYPCERERDLKTLEQLKAGTYRTPLPATQVQP